MSEIIAAVGIISRVTHDQTRAIFLDVELAHHAHSTGDPVVARCRWCTPYGGLDFGDWWVPDVGMVVICIFPGFGIEGGGGGDIDDGYAFAVVPGGSRPPVDGSVGTLSSTRRVSRTRDGESLDEHIRGNYEQEVEFDRLAIVRGDDLRDVTGSLEDLIQGNVEATVEGSEERETVGMLRWLLRSASEFLGDLALSIVSQTTLTLTGTTSVALTGGATQFTAAAEALLSSAAIRLSSAVVELGSGALLRLMDERMVAAHNAHRHSGSATPDVQLTVAAVCTINTQAS